MAKSYDLNNSADEIELRWRNFILKLEDRLVELYEVSIPELAETYKMDKDINKMAYHRMVSGVLGQVLHIIHKADSVFAEKVRNEFDEMEVNNPAEKSSKVIYDKKEICATLLREFTDRAYIWYNKIKAAEYINLEEKYEAILHEFELTKNKFKCTQCGNYIILEKIFFNATHIECLSCKTQNTYRPSSKISQLEHLSRTLAEQRTKHLLQNYEREVKKERDLYHQIHNLKLSIILEKNIQKKIEVEKQINMLEIQRKQSIEEAPKLYIKYMRAMFDEWNKIIPDLKEYNEKVYQSWIKDYIANQ